MFRKIFLAVGLSAALTGCVGYPYDLGTSISTRYTDSTPIYYDYYGSGVDRYDYEYYRDYHRRSNYQRDRDERRGHDGRRNRDGDSRSYERNDTRHDQGHNERNQNNTAPVPVTRDFQNQRQNINIQKEIGQMRGASRSERDMILPNLGGGWQK